MKLNVSTNDFLVKYIFPEMVDKEVNNENIRHIIRYIENEYEIPLSVKLANDEDIDFDFFTLVNSVINDLCENVN